MADSDKITGTVIDSEESVDDILADILNPDGSFNDEFNGLFARYAGGSQAGGIAINVDISDRSGESRSRASVADAFTEDSAERAAVAGGDISFAREASVDARIAGKIPGGVRTVYEEASAEAQRPEFTSTGDVRYPTMGVGASEERVVYDADWEEKARLEAARLERVRQDRMLRGDSAYARTFVAGGMFMSQRNPYVDAPSANSAYIDPLSRDDDFEAADETSMYYNSHKKPFFPEGFSAVPRNSSVAGGKTGTTRSSRPYQGKSGVGSLIDPLSSDRVSSPPGWLQVDEDAGKKKRKKKKGFVAGRKRVKEEEPIRGSADDGIVSENAYESTEDFEGAARPHVTAFSDESLSEVADETRGLRSTVAEIVDKYNKRNEEEARKKREEEARQEELRRQEELKERRRREEVRRIQKEVSPELSDAIDSEEDSVVDDFVDFSTEKATDTGAVYSERTFGVVFDSSAIEGSEFVEKIGEDMIEAEAPAENEPSVASQVEGTEKKGKKRNRKKSGRKGN